MGKWPLHVVVLAAFIVLLLAIWIVAIVFFGRQAGLIIRHRERNEAQKHHRMVCTLVNPLGFLDAHPTVADGVLVGLSLGRIHVQGGRQKTSTKQTAPLTNGCREILARVRDERKKMKIQALVNPFVFQDWWKCKMY
jgi:hypothetical protein